MEAIVKHAIRETAGGGNPTNPENGTLYFEKTSEGTYAIRLKDSSGLVYVSTVIKDGNLLISPEALASRVKALEAESSKMFEIKGTITISDVDDSMYIIESNEGTESEVSYLPSGAGTGDAYRVKQDGTYKYKNSQNTEASLVCDEGDWIVAGSNSSWAVIQGNIDLNKLAISYDESSRTISLKLDSKTLASFALPNANKTTNGLVTLVDEANSDYGVNSGKAATPKAVSAVNARAIEAYNLAGTKITEEQAKAIKVNNAINADKATSDSEGRKFTETYALKSDIPDAIQNAVMYEVDSDGTTKKAFDNTYVLGDNAKDGRIQAVYAQDVYFELPDENAEDGVTLYSIAILIANITERLFDLEGDVAAHTTKISGIEDNIKTINSSIQGINNVLKWGTW